jgi:serine/threonine-protein kinase RsbW
MTIQGTADDSQTLTFEIRCPVQSRVLSLMRSMATSVAHDMGFPEEDVDQIEMAVDEACANVVRHAYKHLGISPDLSPEEAARITGIAPDQCILKVCITLGEGLLRFEIIDNGIGKNRRPAGVASLDEYIEREGKGGLGTMIMHNFMDEVEFEYPEGRGTVVRMTKYLGGASRKAG